MGRFWPARRLATQWLASSTRLSGDLQAWQSHGITTVGSCQHSHCTPWQQWTQQSEPALQNWILAFRGFHATPSSQKSLEVKIQSMGESISEGTVAAVLKQPGEAVEEDEPILQIETDKVTIDVRAPERGKLESVLVKADDTVTTGQLVAVVLPGEEGSSSQQSTSQPESKAEPSKEQPKESQSQPKQPSSSQSDEQSHRKPLIQFPRRRLPDGTRISDLPAEERKRHSQESASSSQSQPQSQQQPKQSNKSPPRKTAPWYVGKEEGTKLSQSQVLTDREMEMIELGGAA